MSNSSSPSKPSPLYQMQLDLEHQQQILGLQMQLDQLQQQQITSELIDSPQQNIFSELAARAARSRSFSRDHARQHFNNLTLQSIQTQQQILQNNILQSQYSPIISPQTQNIRRARAETFSSFPSKIVDEISREGSPRNRSGSLAMPSTNISNAFGQSIFTSSWEPNSGSPLDPENITTISTNSINEMPEDTSSIARTLDLLGLDDPETSQQFGSPAPASIFSPLGFRERSHSNSSPTNSSPVSEIAARLGPQTNAAAASVAAALRARSYSIPVGENLVQNLSISIPPNLRPRATSIAYLESERDVGQMPVGTPARERSGSASSQNAPMGSVNMVGYGRSKLGMVEEPSIGGSPDSVIDNDPHFRNEMQFSLEYAPPSALTSATYFPSISHVSPFPENGNPNLNYGSPIHQTPSRSLWIGNIDPALSASDLLTQFTPFGSIESLRILPDKECAFVNYVKVEDAVVARDTMQGSRIGNCVVKIGFGRPEINDSMGIGNIPPTTDPTDIEHIFSQFGQVESARVLTHKNCGFVNFFTIDDAITARKAMNGAEIAGSIVKIGFAKVPDLVASNITPTPPQEASGTVGMSREASYSSQMAQFAQQQAAFYQSQLGFLSPQRNAALLDSLGPPISPLPGVGKEDIEELEYLEDRYFTTVSMLPEPNPNRRVDQSRAREMRKRLEGHVSGKEVEAFFLEVLDDAVDLCTDYIGNVVIQKLMEKCNDAQRQRLIDRIAPHISSIGIHKNGTWAAQKIIDCARTPGQIQSIVTSLQAYTPPLLLDQFGNY
ncbi:hypothetical protein HK096_002595, partial [Nowakowskiella sp. JEL0078]